MAQDIAGVRHHLGALGRMDRLATTEGSRDGLGLACIPPPRPSDLYYRKPPPLVERRLRYEVNERVDFRGEVLVLFDVTDVAQVA